MQVERRKSSPSGVGGPPVPGRRASDPAPNPRPDPPLSHPGLPSGLSTVSASDTALVARTLDGDLGAFATLMSRYRDSLGRYAFHMLGSREDAEEAV